MTSTAPASDSAVDPAVDPAVLPDDAAGVLAFARSRRAAADRAEADLLEAAVRWAIIHPGGDA